ncbi:MAG: hypothetical protein IPG34_19540 [Rhodocyclaceae bacterium]|nr:hypothetical protein [Rhodocyclaceae bacterium]
MEGVQEDLPNLESKISVALTLLVLDVTGASSGNSSKMSLNGIIKSVDALWRWFREITGSGPIDEWLSGIANKFSLSDNPVLAAVGNFMKTLGNILMHPFASAKKLFSVVWKKSADGMGRSLDYVPSGGGEVFGCFARWLWMERCLGFERRVRRSVTESRWPISGAAFSAQHHGCDQQAELRRP